MTGWDAESRGDQWPSWSRAGGYGGDEHPTETTMPLPPVDDRYGPDEDSGRSAAGATPLDRLGWGDPGPERRRPAGRGRPAGPVAGRVVMAAALVVAVFGAGGIAALANSGGPDVIAEPGRSGLATPTRPATIRPAPTRDLEPTAPPAPAQEFPPRNAPGPAITPGTPRPVPVQPPITGANEPAPSSTDADAPAAGDGEADDATGGAAGDEDDAGSTSAAPRSGPPDDGDDSDAGAGSAEPTYSERPASEAGQERAADDPPAGPTRLIPIRPEPPEQPPAGTTAPDAAPPATTPPATTPPATTPPATTPPQTTPPTTSSVPPTSAPPEDPDQTDEPDNPPARTVGPIVIPAEPDGSLPVGPIVIPTGPDGALPTGTVTATPTPDQGADRDGGQGGDQGDEQGDGQRGPGADATTSATATTSAPPSTTTTREPAPQPGDPIEDADPAPGGSAGGAGSRTGAPITSGSLPPAAGRLSALLPAQPGAAWECRPLAAGVPGAPLSGRWFTCEPAGDANPPPANSAADSTAATQPRPAGRGRRRAPSSRSGLEVV